MRRAPRFFYGWVIVAVSFLAMFSGTLASAYGLTVLLVPMSEELGWSRTAIVGANVPASISAAIASPFLGRIAARYGARVPMAIAAVVGGLSIAAVGWIHDLWIYYLIFGVINGASRPMIQVIGVSVGVAEWFVRRRALASGLVSLGSPVAGLIGIPLASLLVLHLGWRSAWVVLGGIIILLVAVPSGLFWRPRPEALGLLPDGDAVQPLTTQTRLDRRAHTRWGAHHTQHEWAASDALRTRSFWATMIIPPLINLSGPALTTHVVALFISRGLKVEAAAAAATSFVVGTLLGRPFWGFLSGRLHIQYCYVVLGLITAVGTVGVVVSPTFVMASLSVMIAGVAGGGLQQLRLQIWPDYFGRASIATLLGYTAPFELAAGTVGPLLAAWVFDRTGSYSASLLFFAATSMVCVVAMFLLGGPPPEPATSGAPDERTRLAV